MKRTILGGLAVLIFPLAATAADHAEAPGAQADPAADIADFYAWHTDDGDMVVIVTFAPLAAAGAAATYDADVLYGVHFDSTADGVADHDVWVRYGQDGDGNWGVQVSGLSADPVVGPVGETLESGGVKVWTGSADDPFFFDLQGYQETVATGTVAFDSSRDSLAGTNVTAIALEFPAADFVSAEGTVSTWATTGRK